MAPSRKRSSTTVKVSSQTYSQKQRGAKCNTLEPVLEHCEVPSQKSSVASCQTGAHESTTGKSRSGKPLRILLKLRDGYVKLMNDLSVGADLSGVSSFYGCPGAGGDCPMVGAMANARAEREEREREVMIQALQAQMAQSRQFTAVIA